MLEILISKGANINAKDKYGKTPLHIASNHNFNEVGEILISNGANINTIDGIGQTPLHQAAIKNSKDMGELLITKGAYVNSKDISITFYEGNILKIKGIKLQ